MFRFEHIEYLYLLAAVPAILILYFVSLKLTNSRIKKLGDVSLIKKLIPSWSIKYQHVKLFLFALALVFLSVAWANPQWGYKKAKAKSKSTDIFIAPDISQSMLAEDTSPNRLERAKRFTTRLLKKLKSERVGLIFFAGNAYLQVPITNDIASVELFVKSANTEQAGTQGTAIAEAINLAYESLNFDDDNNYKKGLIVITDGENHEQDILDAAKVANEKGVIVYAIGVGTEEGDYVRVINRGYKEYKKDASGQPIRTSLNTQLIKDLAEAGGGLSFLINNEQEVIDKIIKDISQLEKRESELQSFSEFNSYYQYFLFMAILLLVLEFLLTNKKSKNAKSKLFG